MKTVLIVLWLAINPYSYEKVEILNSYQPHDWDCMEIIKQVSTPTKDDNGYVYDNKLIIAYSCGEIVEQKNS